MKLLIDNSVSWRVARDLVQQGHDAVHVASLSMESAPDPVIYARATQDERAIITQDADFGLLRAADRGRRVGVVLLRMTDGRPATHSDVLAANLPEIEAGLLAGAYVIIEDDFIRLVEEP